MSFGSLRSRRLGVYLSASLIAISGFSTSISVLASQPDDMFQLVEDQGLVRLQLSIPVGALEQSQLSKNGNQLILVLKDQNREQWSEMAKQLGQSGQGVRSARLIEQQGHLLMLIDLQNKMQVVDETMVLGSSGQRVQWEVVMMPVATTAHLPVPEKKLQISSVNDIRIEQYGNLNQLIITGDSSLVAELSFPEKGNGLMLSFPNIDQQQLAKLIANNSALSLIAKTRIGQDSQGYAYLILETDYPLDVIDAQAKLEGNHSVTRIDFIADMQAKLEAKPVKKIEVHEQTGQLHIYSNDVMPIQTFFLENPRRLMVDLLGVSPEKVELAVAQFKTSPDVIRSIRFGDTRLGSTRLELTPSDAFLSRLAATGVLQPSGESLALVAIISDDMLDNSKKVLVTTEDKFSESLAQINTGVNSSNEVAVAAPTMPSSQEEEKTSTTTVSQDELLSTGAAVAGVAAAVIAAPVAAVAAAIAVLSNDDAKTEKMEPKPKAESVEVEPEKARLSHSEPTVVATTPASVASGQFHMIDTTPMSGLDLRYRPKFDFTQQPRVSIKPISLTGKAYDPNEQLPSITQGKGYALMSLFDAAMAQDSAYQVAKAEYLANIEAQPQARAGYLPQASFDLSYANTRQSVNRSGSILAGGYEYPYHNWALTLTQPIFRMQNLIKMDQADVAVEQAKLALLVAEQDLIMRVANAYLGILAAKDALELVKAEREATEKQYELAQTRFKNGLGTITQLSESKGRVALVKAREIDAEYKLSDARLNMKQIVGDEIADVTTFKEDFSPAMTVPNAPEPWIKAALEQNLALQTRRMAIDIAQLEVKRQNAAYMPTVDAVASAGQRDTERTLYSASREQVDTNYDVTLKLRMPLYDGGMTPSLVRESTARLDKAKQEHQQEYRQTEKLVRSAFMGVKTTTEMLTALRESVKAQELTMNAKLEGYKAGVDSVVSVLDSYRSYYSSRRDYLQSRYDYLVNRLKLKQSVGTLSREDLAELTELLY